MLLAQRSSEEQSIFKELNKLLDELDGFADDNERIKILQLRLDGDKQRRAAEKKADVSSDIQDPLISEPGEEMEGTHETEQKIESTPVSKAAPEQSPSAGEVPLPPDNKGEKRELTRDKIIERIQAEFLAVEKMIASLDVPQDIKEYLFGNFTAAQKKQANPKNRQGSLKGVRNLKQINDGIDELVLLRHKNTAEEEWTRVLDEVEHDLRFLNERIQRLRSESDENAPGEVSEKNEVPRHEDESKQEEDGEVSTVQILDIITPYIDFDSPGDNPEKAVVAANAYLSDAKNQNEDERKAVETFLAHVDDPTLPDEFLFDFITQLDQRAEEWKRKNQKPQDQKSQEEKAADVNPSLESELAPEPIQESAGDQEVMNVEESQEVRGKFTPLLDSVQRLYDILTERRGMNPLIDSDNLEAISGTAFTIGFILKEPRIDLVNLARAIGELVLVLGAIGKPKSTSLNESENSLRGVRQALLDIEDDCVRIRDFLQEEERNTLGKISGPIMELARIVEAKKEFIGRKLIAFPK